MNDWFWGRLDAAAVLCRMVLDPERLRRVGMILGADRLDPTALYELARRELTTLTEGLLGDEPLPPEMARWHDAALKELADALGDHTSAPQLPSLAAYAAYPLQARIALEELPVIASAIAQDRVEGASPAPAASASWRARPASARRFAPTSPVAPAGWPSARGPWSLSTPPVSAGNRSATRPAATRWCGP